MSEYVDNSLCNSVLRFNPIQVAEWLHQLLAEKAASNQRTLSQELGVDRTRVQQFLYLFRIPEELRFRLKGMEEVTEGELWPLTKMDGREQRTTVGHLLGGGGQRTLLHLVR
jgi:ParB-like chromosome segregation protein Spo0J